MRGALAALLALAALPAARRVLALDPHKVITQYVHDSWGVAQGLPNEEAHPLCQTRDGYLWIGTMRGLVRFDGVRFAVFDGTKEPALKNAWITALHEDRHGSLWIGDAGGGLVRYRDGAFKRVATPAQDGSWMTAIHEDRRGDLWIGSYLGGLFRLHDGAVTSFTKAEGLAGNSVSAILEERDGSLLVGTFDGGVNRYADGRLTTVLAKTPGDAGATSLLRARQSNLWVGTHKGVLRFRGDEVTAFDAKHPLPGADEFFVLCEDRDGNIWIGMDGLARYAEGKITSLTKRDSLTGDISGILEDREGSLWIASRGGGLHRLDIQTGEVELGMAGIPHPFHVTASGAVTRLKLSGTPLGYLKRIVPAAATRTLAPGDRLVLVTDGLVEQLNEAGEDWGYGGVESALATLCSGEATPEDVARGLLAACERHGAGQTQSDDRTVVVLVRRLVT